MRGGERRRGREEGGRESHKQAVGVSQGIRTIAVRVFSFDLDKRNPIPTDSCSIADTKLCYSSGKGSQTAISPLSLYSC